MKLPKRSRTHELESISLNKLNEILPINWVFSENSKREYGIDGTIELFSETQEAIGVKILIQLKSSDEKTNKILKEKLKNTTINYWKEHLDPVLILKYSTNNNSFYYYWGHEIIQSNKKTTTITFKEENILSKENFTKIKNDLMSCRIVKNQGLNFPLRGKLSFKDSDPTLISSIKFRNNLYSRELNNNRFISISENEENYHFEVCFYKDDCIIRIGGGLSTFSSKILKNSKTNSFDYSLILLSILLFLKKIPNIHTFLNTLNFKIDDLDLNLLEMILPIFIKNEDLENTIYTLKRILNENKLIDLMPFISIKINENSNNHQLKIEFINQIFKEFNDLIIPPQKKGVFYFNWGQSLLNQGDFKNALLFFFQAKKLDRSYLNRDYFYGNIGACLFELGKFKNSSLSYEKAIHLSTEEKEKRYHSVKAGDCHLRLKAINKAKHHWDFFLQDFSPIEDDSYWVLKTLAFDHICNSNYIEKYISQEKLIEDVIFDLDFFVNIGINEQNNEEEDSFWSFIWSGILDSEKTISLENALFKLISYTKDKKNATLLLIPLIKLSIKLLGHINWILSLKEIWINQFGQSEVEFEHFYLQYLEPIITEIKKTEKNNIELRFIQEDGSYKSIFKPI